MERRDGDGIGNPKSVSDFEGVEASSVFWIPRSVYCSSVSTRRITSGTVQLEVNVWVMSLPILVFATSHNKKWFPTSQKRSR